MPKRFRSLLAAWRTARHRRRSGGGQRRTTLESLEPRQLLAADVVITELMASNKATLLDGDGQASDWIEIHNPTDQVVSLDGWSLTDDPNDLTQWAFPPIRLEPSAYLVTFASGKDRANDPFRVIRDFNATPDGTFLVDLPAGTYDVRLTLGDDARIRDQVVVNLQGVDVDTVSTEAGRFVSKTYTAEVTAEGGGQLAVRLEDLGGATGRAAIDGLIITPRGGGEPRRFDFGTSDSPVDPGFLPVTPATVFDAGTGYGWQPGAVLSAQDRPIDRDEPHTNFKLNPAGDFLALVAPDGTIVSQYGTPDRPFPRQVPDVSYGTVDVDGQTRIGYMATPTPGAGNQSADAVTGPVIRQVTENPGAVDDNEDLVIEATVDANAAPVDSVQLVYRVMFAKEVTVAMVDDGSGSDAVAGDGIYTATIPHTVSEPGQMVRWAVTAIDATGHGSRAPLFPGVQFSSTLFTFQEDFDAAGPLGIRRVQGTWNLVNGRYQAASVDGGDALAIVPSVTEFTDHFSASVTVNAPASGLPKNGAILFDYQSPTDFKFALIDITVRRLQIGRRTADGWEILDNRFWSPLKPDQDYQFEVEIQGSKVNLILDGITRGTYEFDEPLNDGLIGLATHDGNMVFDDLTIGPKSFDALPTNAPQYFGTVIARPSLDTNLPVLQWFVQNTTALNTSGSRGSLFYRGQFYDNIFMDLHGQSTRSFPKKSFNVHLNSDRKFEFSDDASPVSDFNLLTNYADKTKIRNTLAFEVYRNAGHPAHQAFPIRIERNGSFFAVEDFVEEGDAEYLADNGLDPNGALYKVDNPLNSTKNDVKKRTRKYEDRTDLAELIASANLSPEERNAWLLDNLDLASFANFLAAMVVTASVDCCHKNFYVYRDTEGTGQWRILPWDLDLSFGHNWNSTEGYFDDDLIATAGFFQGNDVIRPLYDAPGFRQMYLRRLRTLMDNLLQPPETPTDQLRFEARIDDLIDQIGDDAAIDQAKWGFPGPFAPQTPREAANDIKNIFLPARRNFLYNTYNQTAPAENQIPAAQLGVPEIQIAEIESAPASGNLDEQYIKLVNPNSAAVDISNWRLGGSIDYRFRAGTVIPAGGAVYVTPNVPAFLARTSGPGGGQGLFVQGHLEGHLPTSGASVDLIPLGGHPLNQLDNLRITEVNYNPQKADPGQGDLDVDNDRFEFIELTNTGDTPIDLQGARFTDGIQFTFGDVDLPAGERIVVVRDQAAFESRYGSELAIAGEFASGKLSNRGETIRLEDFHHRTIVRFTYGDRGAWPSRADGLGGTLEVIDTAGDYNDPTNWQGSVAFGGSPGAARAEPRSDVLINEVLARPATGGTDQIELFNTTDAAVDLSGWYLSNRGNDLLKYPLAGGTTIGAGSHLSLDTAAIGFTLDGLQGGELWLIASDANGKPLRFVQQVPFGGAAEGISLGRWHDGDPNSPLLPMASPSFGAANTGPLASDVIVSEVHYNPALRGNYTNDFEANASGLVRVAGDWTLADGRFHAVPGADNDALTIISDLGPLSRNVSISATIKIPVETDVNRNGLVIFDYQSPTDFKFASIHTSSGKWRIGNHDADGWHFLAQLAERIAFNLDHELRVELRGSVATVFGNNAEKVSFDFGESLSDGAIGLGTKHGEASFGSLQVTSIVDAKQYDFVELFNRSDHAVDLSGWQLAGGIDFAFAEGTRLEAGASLVVTGVDPAETIRLDDFRRRFSVDADVTIVGPYAGLLDDHGGSFTLLQPLNGTDPASGPSMVVDDVVFDATPPWPATAAGGGHSLQRVAVDSFGGLASGWRPLDPTPGSVAFAIAGDLNGDGQVDMNDIRPFVLAIADPVAYENAFGAPAALAGDLDGDGDLDYDDIDELVALIQEQTTANQAARAVDVVMHDLDGPADRRAAKHSG